jgi:hypothetical protein
MNNEANRSNESANGAFGEKMRAIRFRMKREKFKFSKEIRLVPKRLIYTVIGLFVLAQIISQIIFWISGERLEPHWSPEMNALALAGIVTFVSLNFAIVIFLIGYINRDAKRRGMNSTLWTILVIIFVPAYLFIGFLVYFLLREPLPFNCSECGTEVSARFNYCPKCKHNLRPACPKCNREVHETDLFCPFCSNDLTTIPDEQESKEDPVSPTEKA